MRARTWPISLILITLSGATLLSQSLADVARKEEERRKSVEKPGRVYTDRDLPPVPAGGAAATPPPAGTESTSSASAGAATASKDPAGEKAPDERAADAAAGSKKTVPVAPRVKRDEEHWRERAQLIRSRLDRLRADAAAIEGRIARLTAELAGAPPPRATALRTEIRQATEDLSRFQKEIPLIDQEWATFEERVRVAKVPADWVR